MNTSEQRTREPLKDVLVPTDFSRGADLALRRALLLPLAEGAGLHVIHVLPPDLPATARSKAAADAKHALDRVISRVRRRAADRRVTLTSEILQGKPFVEIIRCSRNVGAELIVLGRHGRRPVRDMFISTTAQRVVCNGDVPVLVVNLKPDHPYRRPLIATDLRDTTRRTFELALRVLGPGITSINVVHAFHVPFEGFVTPDASAREKSEYRMSFKQTAVASLTAFLATYEDLGIRWRTGIRHGDARSVVLGEAALQRADLVALGTHGRSGVAHALLGSVAEWVITAATCDVLVARPIRFTFELP